MRSAWRNVVFGVSAPIVGAVLWAPLISTEWLAEALTGTEPADGLVRAAAITGGPLAPDFRGPRTPWDRVGTPMGRAAGPLPDDRGTMRRPADDPHAADPVAAHPDRAAQFAGFRDLALSAAKKFEQPPLPRPRRASRSPYADSVRLEDLVYRVGGWPHMPTFDLRKVRAGRAAVPRVFVAALPGALSTLNATDARKDLFVMTLLPLVLDENERIAAARARLMDIAYHMDAGVELATQDMEWLAELAADYGVELSAANAVEELIRRVDRVPPSLALAQAAEESGWGTSRFARKGNAVFGQRTWSQGAGIVPRQRAAGERHEVRTFGTLGQSIAAYMRNLNTHPAYATLRRVRATMHRDGRPLSGYALAVTLQRYSERGVEYTKTVRRIIRANRFGDFDDARLRGQRVAALSSDTF